jgi:hypothetical protein
MTSNQADMEQTTMSTNTKRAACAQTALEAFQKECKPPHGEIPDAETALGDLIANLLHLAESLGLDPIAVVQNSIGMWNAESQAPDGEPYANDYATVTIERHTSAEADAAFQSLIDDGSIVPHPDGLQRRNRKGELEPVYIAAEVAAELVKKRGGAKKVAKVEVSKRSRASSRGRSRTRTP